MKSKSRRYEVLLPLQFNDGREVPGELLRVRAVTTDPGLSLRRVELYERDVPRG